MNKRFRAWLNEAIKRARRGVRWPKLFSTGQQPSFQPVRFKTRPRKIRKLAQWAIRKKAKFTVFHTGLFAATPNVVPWLKTHPRKIKKYSWQVRKRAHFGLVFHTAAQPSRICVMQTRKRKVWKKKARPNRYFRQWMTGLSPAPGGGTRPWLGTALMSGGYRRGGE